MDWALLPISALPQYSADWTRLQQQNGDSLLLDLDFLRLSLKHFGKGDEQLAICNHHSQIIAITVLCKQGFGRWQSFQPSQAPLGFFVHHSDYTPAQLLSNLLNALPQLPLILALTRQDPALSPRPQNSAHICSLDYIPTARISITGSFEDYWAARGKNLRQNLRRQRNRLERENISTELKISRLPEDMRGGVVDYAALESSGWKAQAGSAVSLDNAQGAFYVELFETLAQRGLVEIHRYYYAGKVTAVDLCGVHKGILYLLKTTYDEAQKTSSPTMLMRQEILSKLFAEQTIHSVEFYGRIMDWHTKWSNEYRVMYHLNAYRWGFLAQWHSRRFETETLPSNSEPLDA